jgi:hypothetical protein
MNDDEEEMMRRALFYQTEEEFQEAYEYFMQNWTSIEISPPRGLTEKEGNIYHVSFVDK